MFRKGSLLVLFAALCFSVFGQNADNFETVLNDGSITITGFKGAARDVVIPEKLNGIPVTSLRLMENVYESTKTISLPSGVEDIYIGISVCPNLEAVIVSQTNGKFKTIDGVLYDKPGKILLFYPYAKKDSSFTVPDGVETIGGRVGSSIYNTISAVCCVYLKTVVIPATVKLIEACAFAGCENLTNIMVPPEGIKIEYSAFLGCENMDAGVRNALEERFGEDLFWGPW
jgi:hypothetical protein